MNGEAIVRTHADNAMSASEVRKLVEQGHTVYVRWSVEEMPEETPKTEKQRGALHVWLRDLAQILNDSGCDQVTFINKHLKQGTQIPWTLYSVKENLYKPILAAMTGKMSTEQMNTVEPSKVCLVLGQKLSEKLGITPPAWPTRFGND